jgi:hypothetical protein
MTAAVSVGPAPEPAAADPSLLAWLHGSWWAWSDAQRWVQLAVDRSLRWSDPVAPGDAELADARAALAGSHGRPVARAADAWVTLYTSEQRGRVVVRRFAASGAAALPPPPVAYLLEPHGGAGTSAQDRIRRSVQIVAQQIAADCRRWEVIEWARQTIYDANLPLERGKLDPVRQMGALFGSLKARTVFVRDPVNTEAVASTVAILCLDPGGVCLRGGDCDDMIVALGSGAIAIGIPVRLATRTYAGKDQGHIVLQYDASPRSGQTEWRCIDPQHESGQCTTLPYLTEIITDIELGNDGEPMFVGIGEAPDAGPSTLGADPTAAMLSPEESAGWVQVLGTVKATLDRASARLRRNAQAYAAVRADLGFPANDPPAPGESPTAPPIAAYVNSVAAGQSAWTTSAEAAQGKLLATADFISGALADGLSGKRSLSFDGRDLFVAALPGDPYGLALVTDPTTGTTSLQYTNAAGQPTGGTLGIAPILVGIGLIAVAVVSAAAAYAVAKYCDFLATSHHDDALSRITDNQAQLIQSGKATPQQVVDLTKAQTDLAKAAAPPPPAPTDWATAGKWIGVGILAVAGAIGLMAIARVVESVSGRRGGAPQGAAPYVVGDPRGRYIAPRGARRAARDRSRSSRRRSSVPMMVGA